MSIYTYDRINLVDLSAKIVSFAKTHSADKEFSAINNCTSYNGILDFLLKGINDGKINNLKKLSSGNVAVSSLDRSEERR